MKQQRLNFSDYTAEQQEADAHKAKKLKVPQHAYLMKIDGEWAHFIVGQNGKDDYDFYEEMTLTAVYNKLKREKPEYTVKVIRNEGLENYLRDRRGKRKVRQLRIDFSKER
jgi:hypothetical protein